MRRQGETLAQKIRSIDMRDWANNTNLQAAFRHVLEIAATTSSTLTGPAPAYSW